MSYNCKIKKGLYPDIQALKMVSKGVTPGRGPSHNTDEAAIVPSVLYQIA